MATKQNSSDRSIAQITNSFEIVEAYKTLRANLIFSMAPMSRKVIVISGPEPNTGKSTTSCHIAVMMAQTSKRVLLIDADLRRPKLHRFFRVNHSGGLTSHLLSGGDWEKCVCKEVAPHLDLMTAGPIPPNPSELLGSQRMSHFLDQVAEQYDYVLIDTSPINVVTDALVLSARTAGTVLVARQNQTGYDELQQAIEGIKKVNGTLLGVVLNDYQPSLSEEKRLADRQYGYGEPNEKK